MNLKYKKHLFFDKDNTITRSKSPIEPEIHRLLTELPHDIIIVSGQDTHGVQKEINGLKAIVMGQNGNHALDIDGTLLWNTTLSNKDSGEILQHIGKLIATVEIIPKDQSDLIEHRGAQLCYSVIGHNEDISLKEKFDPDQSYRERMLEDIPFNSDSVEVKIGGTTTFDYFAKGKNKGHYVQKLIDLYGWEKEDCVYFGDKLMPGGNDESVVGVIETISVKNHRDTFEILNQQLA